MSKTVDFIIVGAQKGGTSSAKQNLGQHPEIELYQKEIHYFDRDENHEKGTKWYLNHFKSIQQADKYQNIKIRGEKTPAYIYFRKCHVRMYQEFPKAKLIIFLRDPIKRAYSHYMFNYHLFNYPKKYTFKYRLDMNLKKMQENPEKQYRTDIIQRGFYIDQIEHLLKYYPRNQVYICISERCKKDPLKEYNKVLKFLNIRPLKNKELKYTPKNVGKYNQPIDKECYQLLKKIYEPYNERLFKFLGYRIKEWN